MSDLEIDFYVEPSQYTDHNVKLIQTYFPYAGITRNHRKYGVSENPFWALHDSFKAFGADYTILAEEDLVVSDDIVEYHKWASQEYQDQKDVSMICSFSPFDTNVALSNAVLRVPNFASVWIWGTWRDRWEDYLRKNWDLDMSTGDESGPGGWDWHFNKRVLPSLGKKSIQPLVSRVQNIGVEGTHQTAEWGIVTAPNWTQHKEPTNYVELGR